MKKFPFAAVVLLIALAAGAARAAAPIRISTGFIAHELCSGAFVSGLDPDQVYRETLDAMSGASLIRWGVKVQVDRPHRQVTATLFGLGRSRAVYHDGEGCQLVFDDAAPPTVAAPSPIVPATDAGSATIEPPDPRLRAALDQAFAERDAAPFRHTHAVVIMKDGRVIGERYAPGYNADTAIHGYSATKSVTSALIGILVRQGKLAVDAPAQVVDAWRNPDDPHHAITVDQLLRHTAGLDMGSSLNASLASAFARVNQMKFAEPDMAAYAANSDLESAPGTSWNYHDGNFVLLSRLIRDAAGGDAGAVLGFAQRELFEPLGMHNVTLELDPTGTPDGSSQMLAPARDWARFGQLYLDDGVVAGRRILPEGWVHYSSAPTPGAWPGLGAGFWTNLGDSMGARVRVSQGMPPDAFMARGAFGQYVIIIPSERLVIARFGTTGGPRDDQEGVSRLVAQVIAATGTTSSIRAQASR